MFTYHATSNAERSCALEEEEESMPTWAALRRSKRRETISQAHP